MRLQSQQNMCGAASLANAFRALGLAHVTEDRVTALMRKLAPPADAPEQDGAGIRPLQVAASKYGYALVAYKHELPELALAALLFFLDDGKPALLSVNDDAHWVAAIGRGVGGRVLIADPADAEVVVPLTPDQLILAWRPGYYMLLLTKKPRKAKK